MAMLVFAMAASSASVLEGKADKLRAHEGAVGGDMMVLADDVFLTRVLLTLEVCEQAPPTPMPKDYSGWYEARVAQLKGPAQGRLLGLSGASGKLGSSARNLRERVFALPTQLTIVVASPESRPRRQPGTNGGTSTAGTPTPRE